MWQLVRAAKPEIERFPADPRVLDYRDVSITPAPGLRVARLEDQLQSELDQPWSVRLAADDPKRTGIVDACRRPSKHYTIEDVVELGAELNVHPLGDVCVLEQRNIFVVVEGGSHVGQTGRRISERIRSGLAECGDVQVPIPGRIEGRD